MRALISVLLLVSAAVVLPACTTSSPVAPAPVETVALSWTVGGNSLTVGETLQLQLKGTRDGQELTLTTFASWTSDDESVATVSDAGLVTAVSAGEAVISATYLAHQLGARMFVQ